MTTSNKDDRVIVGYSSGGLDVFSLAGQLQRSALQEKGVFGVGLLSDQRYVVLDKQSDISLFTPEFRKLNVAFKVMRQNEGGGVFSPWTGKTTSTLGIEKQGRF